MILVLITLLMCFLVACGTEAENIPSEPEVVTRKIPQPASMNSCEWECGTYYSEISALAIKNYLQQLKEDGWEDMEGNELSVEVQTGISQYMLTKDSGILQIMINNDDNGGSYNNSVLVKLYDNLPVSQIKNRKGAIQKNEALKLIQPVVDSMAQTDEFMAVRKNIIGLFEVFIEDAYEKSNIQAFSAVSDIGFTGCFLLCNKSVAYVHGGLDNACVADIDKDDDYELLVLDHTYYSDVYAIDLYAYKYYIPAYLSLPVKGLYVAYQNRFVPKFGYPKLGFKILTDNEVNLVSENTDYGIIETDGPSLIVENTRAFPFKQWGDIYDQTRLMKIDKEIPEEPPPIKISIDGKSINYIVQTTQWNGSGNKKYNAFREIMSKKYPIPTIKISDDNKKSVRIDFGDFIPDSIKVSDSLLDRNGNNRYSYKEILDRAVKIVDNRRVEFQLEQHIALFFSSNIEDYKKDWYRLFKITCVWGGNECEYSFLIDTRNTRK